MKTTANKIAELEFKRYRNYTGGKLKAVMRINRSIQHHVGDESYLKYLENLEKINPRPVYVRPDLQDIPE